ncbi:MAG: hypothetical protein GX660_01265, partial [Clostridiaceae bacterium]|nr:hypothetical protein [Clostridiaceae bacterium]
MSDNSLIKDRLIVKINDLKSNLNARRIKFLHLERLENIVNKLEQYSGECSKCDNYLKDLDNDLLKSLSFDDLHYIKKYLKGFKSIVSHLCKKHKHTTESSFRDSFMLLGISVGMSLGMIIGLAIDSKGTFQIIGMSTGMCFGMSFGRLIGYFMDKDAIK